MQLSVLARLDLDRLQEQLDARALPLYIQLQTQQPAQAGAVSRCGGSAAPATEGPHRGYAGQWAIIAVIWVVGYPVLMRRSAIRRRDEATIAPVGVGVPDQLTSSPPAPVG